jgi:hypothetical protein
MKRALVVLLLLAAPLSPAWALSLYVGEVPVERAGGVTAEQRLAALDEVLSRLTARYDRSLVAQLGITAGDLGALVLSQQLVERARVEPDGDRVEALRVQVEFDEMAVNELLADNGLPRWGRERPPVLLWIAVEDAQGARFADDPRLEYVVREQARRIGLDVLRPLGDALDLAEVTLADVRGGFLGAAGASARRYGADVIAMLDLRAERVATGGAEEARRWSGRWNWRVEGRDAGFSRTAGDPGTLVAAGLERLASALAARYAVVGDEDPPRPWRVRVTGIVDELQYAEVLRHFENLSVVESVRVLGADGRRIDFEVVAGARRIRTYLALGDLLVFERENADGMLHFRLAR